MGFELTSPTEWEAMLRIAGAALSGGVIGLNRQLAGKPAGLRTHMLVSVGAALFAVIALMVSRGDPAASLGRVMQGVAAGIGFLGAGEIIHQIGAKPGAALVYGLTSAASIWLTAAIGVTVACGMWKLTAFATAVSLLILAGAWRLERYLPHPGDL